MAHIRYLILGATGTLGTAMTKRLLDDPRTAHITCLSRDELKQVDFKRKFPDDRVSMAIGDIRDKSSIREHFTNKDVVFHFAALKRIPEMEKHPMESLKTNVLGTINAIECAKEAACDYLVFSSTDKACRPINTYGACKFLSEQLLLSANEKSKFTKFRVYRWGNILNSRGAALTQFADSIQNNKPAHLTHQDMTRFWIKIEDAVQYVLDTYRGRDSSNRVLVPKMKAAGVTDFLKAIGRVKNKEISYEIVGMRPGEKLHEDIMFSPESGECLSSSNMERFDESELDHLVRSLE